MKKAVLTLAAVLLLSGCAGERHEDPVYDVYFRAQDPGQNAALLAEQRTLPPGTDPVEGLLQRLLSGPISEDLTRTIPTSVTLRGWTLEDGLLTVDFSGRYGSLSGVDLTLADYSVVLTLTRLEGVETVMITADGDLLSYRDHQGLKAEDVRFLSFDPE